MSENRFNVAAIYSPIKLKIDREYDLVIDLQWYGTTDSFFYSYILASDHQFNEAAGPPYYLMSFDLENGSILPVKTSQIRHSIGTLLEILKDYEDISFACLDIGILTELKDNLFIKLQHNPVIRFKHLHVLTNRVANMKKPVIKLSWGAINQQISEYRRVIGKQMIDHIEFKANIVFDNKYRSHDIREDIRIFFNFNGKSSLTSTSIATAVIPCTNESILVKAGNSSVEWENQQMGLVSAHDFRATDLMYLIARMAGVQSDRIKIEGFTGKEVNIFTVIFLINNFMLDRNFSVANIDFILGWPTTELSFFNQYPKQLTKLHWSADSVTGRVHVSAANLYDAYLIASEEIEKALDIISHYSRSDNLFVNYSNLSVPNNWDMFLSVPIISRSDFALIINETIGSHILLDWATNREPRVLKDQMLIDTIEQNALIYEEAIFYGQEPNKTDLEKQIKALMRSLRWLRRGWESDVIEDKIIYYTIALEFAVVGVKPHPFMLENERHSIIESACTTYQRNCQNIKGNELKNKISALTQKISNALTNIPVMTQIKYAIEQLQIPISQDEIILLRKLREQRNKIVHGGTEKSLSTRELTAAHGIISKLVAARMANLIEEVKGQTGYV